MELDADFTDQDQAFREGWCIAAVANNGHPPFELQRDDEAALFETDIDAWGHVVKQAIGGSQYHLRALKFLEQHAPAEFEIIELHAALVLGLNSVSSLFTQLEV